MSSLEYFSFTWAMYRHPGGLEEPLQKEAAIARYVDYALNAPAWALAEDPKIKLWSPSTYWTGHDLHYFLAVGAIWYLIGYKLDKRLIAKDTKRVYEVRWWNKALAWVCLVYGLFTCYSVFPQKPYPEPLMHFFLVVFDTMLHGKYGWWLQLGLAWGVGLIFIGFYWLFRYRSPARSNQTA